MKHKLSTILFLAAALILIWSVYPKAKEYRETHIGDIHYEDVSDRICSRAGSEDAEDPESSQAESPEAVNGIPDLPDINFEELKAINPDSIGWIYIPDTSISYPIVKPTAEHGHDYCLNHLIDGTRNRIGTIFTDRRCGDIGESDNTIIYGHNLKSGKMFRMLREYKNTEGFYEEHPEFFLITEERIYKCEIFAVTEVSNESKLYTASFSQAFNASDFIRRAAKKNLIHPLTVPDENSRFVTLSTCSYVFEGAKLLVIAALKPCN